MSLGKGDLINIKKKTEKSILAKMVDKDDAIPKMIWMHLFLIEQGYTPHTTILHHDNRNMTT